MVDITSIQAGEAAVYGLALHFGASVGWHVGTAVKSLKCGKSGLRGALSESLQVYDVGLALSLLAVAVATQTPLEGQLALWVLFGIGGGLAYADRNDHPPRDVLSTIRKRLSPRRRT